MSVFCVDICHKHSIIRSITHFTGNNNIYVWVGRVPFYVSYKTSIKPAFSLHDDKTPIKA